MKKINSIGYGSKILGIIFAFTLIIPLIIKIISFIYKNKLLAACAKISFIIGTLVFIFLMVLLIIELNQDKRRNLFYKNKRNTKLDLGKGLFECQACGNRLVKLEDKNCSVCGTLFNYKRELNDDRKSL